jgi:hypothetical protein
MIKFPNLKSGMLQTTTLKRNLVLRFEEARNKYRFGRLGGLSPLKEFLWVV